VNFLLGGRRDLIRSEIAAKPISFFPVDAIKLARQLDAALGHPKMSITRDIDHISREIDRVAVKTGRALAKSYATNFRDKFEERLRAAGPAEPSD
jgi:hypothetical protein